MKGFIEIMETETIGVVILNYNSAFDTINCCDSILLQANVDLKIVIVDNASESSDIDKLSCYICNKNDERIILIQNKENLGFAKGNNIGIRFCRNSLNCKYVFVLNSDCLMSDKYVIWKLLNRMQDNVGVINPTCYGFDKVTLQQPYCLSKNRKFKELIWLITLVAWQSIKGIVGSSYSIHKDSEKSFDPDEYKYIIQGNSYVLTPGFFKHYDCLFPKTFLYLEETVLLWYIQKAGLETVYVKDAIVLHKEAGSNKVLPKSKERFKAKEMRRGLIRILPVRFMNEKLIRRKFCG